MPPVAVAANAPRTAALLDPANFRVFGDGEDRYSNSSRLIHLVLNRPVALHR